MYSQIDSNKRKTALLVAIFLLFIIALGWFLGVYMNYGYGLFAFASSLDQIGPFANSIPDLALLLNVIAGHDTKDSTSVDMQTPDYVDAIQKSGDVIKGLKIGLPKEYFISGCAFFNISPPMI